MNMIQAYVANPVKVAVGVLLLALFGCVSLLNMPMQLTPEVQVPVITVTQFWPGASPFDVERSITQPQEEQLQAVEGVTKMSSQCNDSYSQITLEFQVGTDMEEALLKVNSRLQQVRQYPQTADEPVISTSSPNDSPIAWFILSPRLPEPEQFERFRRDYPELAEQIGRVESSANPSLALFRLREIVAQHPEAARLMPQRLDVTTLRKYVEGVVEKRFERVEGVAESDVYGGRMRELQVVVDPAELAARNLTILDLRDSLSAGNTDTSGGDIWEGKRRYIIRTLGRFTTQQQVANHVVTIRDGAPVYVRDIAEVRLGFKRPQGVVRRFGLECISVNARRAVGANVLQVMTSLQEAAEELNEGELKREGLVLTQVYDETEYIYSSIRLVQQNIVLGGLLTILTLIGFLRSGRSTIVIALAIPTSLIGTFLVLNILGRSLNVISLAGLAFAVGMLVDNAVVVLENIFRHYQAGESPRVAAVRGTQEVWGAVVASTLTTLAVFIPVVFIQEEAGQLFRDIALAISSAVALSLIVSVIVIPTAATRILKPNRAADEAAQRSRSRYRLLASLDRLGHTFVSTVVGINQWLQRSTVRQLGLIIGLVAASVLATLALWPKVEYLPAGNRNFVFALLTPPAGYNLDQLLRLGDDIETYLEPHWNVDADSPEIEQLPHGAIRDMFFVSRGSGVFLGIRAYDSTRAGKLVDLLKEMEVVLPGTRVFASQSSLFERGLGAGRNVTLEIAGDDIDRIFKIAGRMMGMSGLALPGAMARPEPSPEKSAPELQFIPRAVACNELGYSNAEVGYVINALVDGAYATDYFVGGDRIDLTILGSDQDLKFTQDIDRLPVATPTGQLVPLETLAESRLVTGPEQIQRRERQRAVTLNITPPEAMPLQEAIERIEAGLVDPLVEDGSLSGGYTATLSGTVDKLRVTWIALRWNLLLALLITYLLMAALFESWLFPLVIIFTVPLGAVGGVIALKLLGFYLMWQGFNPQSLDVLTMLGFIILIGTVVNNAILIVHQSLNNIRSGRDPQVAVIESVRTRIRPILMTTATTVLGLLPLVLFPGAGSELYRGLGSIVLGGLVISTGFTLFLVPTVFSLAMRWLPPPPIDPESAAPRRTDDAHEIEPYAAPRQPADSVYS